MNWLHIASALGLGGAIGSFFTHAFHIRRNQTKVNGKFTVNPAGIDVINAAGATAADVATAAAQKQIDGASSK